LQIKDIVASFDDRSEPIRVYLLLIQQPLPVLLLDMVMPLLLLHLLPQLKPLLPVSRPHILDHQLFTVFFTEIQRVVEDGPVLLDRDWESLMVVLSVGFLNAVLMLGTGPFYLGVNELLSDRVELFLLEITLSCL
jgi:hypothetical protein